MEAVLGPGTACAHGGGRTARLYGHLGPVLWRFREQGQEGKSPHLSSLCQLLLILKTRVSTTSSRKPSCCGTVDQCPSLHSDCLLRVRHGKTTSLSHSLGLAYCLVRRRFPCPARPVLLSGAAAQSTRPQPSFTWPRGTRPSLCARVDRDGGDAWEVGRGLGPQADGDPDKDLFKRGHGSCADNVLIQGPGFQRNQMSRVA